MYPQGSKVIKIQIYRFILLSVFPLYQFYSVARGRKYIGFISIAMVSNLPTFSGKVFQIPKSFVIPLLIILAILSNAIISNPIKGFIILVLVYLVSIPFASIFYLRLKKKAEALNLKT